MADGSVTIEIDAETAARLKSAAEAAGHSPGEHAALLLAEALRTIDDDWAETKAALAEYDRTGESVDARATTAELRVRLIDRLNHAT